VLEITFSVDGLDHCFPACGHGHSQVVYEMVLP